MGHAQGHDDSRGLEGEAGEALPVRLPVEVLPHGRGLPLPSRATPGAAGLDLVAALPDGARVTLLPGQRMLFPTGLKMAIPQGYEGQVRPRSGLALRSGVTVLNAPGTIDSDYRGEVQVLLINLGEEPVFFRRGDRIAQFLLAPVIATTLSDADPLEESTRGDRGFGSTGISVTELMGGEKT